VICNVQLSSSREHAAKDVVRTWWKGLWAGMQLEGLVGMLVEKSSHEQAAIFPSSFSQTAYRLACCMCEFAIHVQASVKSMRFGYQLVTASRPAVYRRAHV
jgi:hypothetical protein